MWLESAPSDFNGLNLSQLKIDEAWLTISSTYPEPVWLYTVSSNCHKCPFQKLYREPILPNHTYATVVPARYRTSFRWRTTGNSTYATSFNDRFKICDLQENLGQFGVYNIHLNGFVGVDSSYSNHCTLSTKLEPVDICLPIIAVFTVWILCGAFLLPFVASGCKSYFHTLEYLCIRLVSRGGVVRRETTQVASAPISFREEFAATSTNKAEPKQPEKVTYIRNYGRAKLVNELSPASCETIPTVKAEERLKSLDAFRGLCIIIMMFADDGGGGYYFFRHCAWDGLYIADLAFPWFLWICGVCVPFHLKKFSGKPKYAIFKRIWLRSCKLVLLGIFINTSTRASPVDIEHLRLPGVLQRFGVCYFVGSLLYLFFSNTLHSVRKKNLRKWTSYFEDIKGTAIPWILVCISILIHTLLTFMLPVPGCPAGYLGPAGLHENGAFSSECVGGSAGYVDRVIFGIRRIHNRPTSKQVYNSSAFDPEGTLGTITSILQVWLGVQTGVIFVTYKEVKSRIWRLTLWCVFCGAVGLFLCGGYQNQGWIPVNKNLWSLSFVFVTTSAALLLILTMYAFIDVFALWNGSPLLDAGMNSILFYLGHEVCHAMLPWHYSYGRMETHTSKLFESSWGIMIWIYIAKSLHQNRVYFVI